MPGIIASKAIPMEQLTVAATAITSSYTAVGTFSSWLTSGFIMSTLNAAVQISFDGVDDHIAVPAGDSQVVIIPLNLKNNLIVLPTPTVSVKEIGNPSTGDLYICGFTSTEQ